MSEIGPIKELREICQESRYAEEGGMPWFERNFYRRLSIYCTKMFLMMGISANQATLLSFIFGLLGGLFLIFTSAIFLTISALFLILCLIFDRVDGEISRYNRSSSKSGAHFDFMVGATVHSYIIICMTFGAYNALQDTVIFIFGFLAVILNLLSELSRIHLLYKQQTESSEHPNSVEEDVCKPMAHITNFLGPGAIVYAVLIVTALDVSFAPVPIGHVPMLGLFVINARYAFLILHSVGKIGSFIGKIHGLVQ